MDQILKVPTLPKAQQMMDEAQKRNPGPWVQHSIYAAQAAETIASRHPALDPAAAYIMGYLHDIGRRAGVTDLRHTLDGYTYLHGLGFEDAARICLTHSFPFKNAYSGSGTWDCSTEEFDFIQTFLASIEYNVYDRLLQLCDALATSTGYCLIEKRLVDVALRRGINDLTIEKWKAFLQLQKDFEQAIGGSIYPLLPGVVNNTFGGRMMVG